MHSLIYVFTKPIVKSSAENKIHEMHIFILGTHVAIDDFPIIADCEGKGEGEGGACLCMWDGSLGGI